MSTYIQRFCSLVAVGALLICGACQQPDHPNQLNSFDSQSYDSLTLAHAALTSFRGSISAAYPKYKTAFNDAAADYSVALNTYSVYRSTSQNEADVAAAVESLAVSIQVLENSIQSDLNVAPGTVANVSRRAAKRVSQEAGSSIVEVLIVLEIAASVAQTIPQAQASAALAGIVIAATTQAVATEQLTSGKPIDLSTIPVVSPIQ